MHFWQRPDGGSTLSYNGTFRKPTGARTGLTRLASSLGATCHGMERTVGGGSGTRRRRSTGSAASGTGVMLLLQTPVARGLLSEWWSVATWNPKWNRRFAGAECALGALGAEATGSATHARAARRNCSQVHAFHGSSASVADCTRCRWHDAISTRGTTRRAGTSRQLAYKYNSSNNGRGEFITSSGVVSSLASGVRQRMAARPRRACAHRSESMSRAKGAGPFRPLPCQS